MAVTLSNEQMMMIGGAVLLVLVVVFFLSQKKENFDLFGMKFPQPQQNLVAPQFKLEQKAVQNLFNAPQPPKFSFGWF